MVVVFSGYNQRAVVAFLRTLTKDEVNFCIISSGVEDTIFRTVYKEKVAYIRNDSKLSLDDINRGIDIIHKKNKDGLPLMLAPSTEALNRFLLDNRDFFEKNNCIIPLVDKEKYELFSDKEKFCELCLKHDIKVPLSIALPDTFKCSFVAKPKKYYASDGRALRPILVLDKKKFDELLESNDEKEYFYQEYLNGGESYYLLYYCSKNGNIYSFSQQNLAQQLDGGSIIAAKTSDFHLIDNNISQKFVDLLKSEDFFGLVMIEIRRFEGMDYMIEANPRFWGPSQLFCDAGYNFFEFLLKDFGYLFDKEITYKQEQSFYYWSGGITGNILDSDQCSWYGKEEFCQNESVILLSDIYKRIDTMGVYYNELLKGLYQCVSKHSNYQILPKRIKELLNQESIDTISRYEDERLQYILKHVDLKNKSLIDIGGNTGFFTFEAIDNGSVHVDYYEGNKVHAKFVEAASAALGYEKTITVNNEYYMFRDNPKHYDVGFCLNVLHHLGDDFENANDIDKAKEKISKCIKLLANNVDILVFQLGFNWKGNREKSLFDNGTKEEMIQFIENACSEIWVIESIGIAENNNGKICYEELNENNMKRRDELGEFLNRPLFIMKAKRGSNTFLL